jgi:S-DNA-T family DNA segregation ATPase FtsK/SpoIIIE
LIGLGLVAFGLLLLLAPLLPGGWVPDHLLTGVRWLCGTYGTWAIALAFILQGINLLVHFSQAGVPDTSLGAVIICVAFLSLAQLVWAPHCTFANLVQSPGGLIGYALAGGLLSIMGHLAWLPLIVLGLCGVALLTDMPLWMVLALPVKWLNLAVIRPLCAQSHARGEANRAAKIAHLQEEELSNRLRPAVRLGDGFKADIATASAPIMPIMPVPLPSLPTPVIPVEELPAPASMTEVKSEDRPRAKRITGVPSADKPEQLQFADDNITHPSNRPYDLPPSTLLTLTPKSARHTPDDTQEKIVTLEQTLSSFGIDAKVVAVERGPRVTRFELVPPPGIRINRITNLADNIALSLAALDVRVEAPVPGKGVVGIEVPNKEPVIVDLRELIESEPFQKGRSSLTVVLGRDITGHPRMADLTRMPHLLIAGATNSGKSVCINSIICSILMRATPHQVKFLMVDPKRVELSLFQSIPHLIAPVAYDAKHAAGLLRWAIREMEQRYEMFADKGVRNIIGFNENARLEGLEEIPYIVIIIDELADLMMQAAAEFEASICRIAQLARATGIHLVIATQRPSVNVITGTIKANIPSRIAFAVASQVDSRTILDMNGAERLVGMGDMLFLPVDASKPGRIQGAYVSEKDINRIVEHVKMQGKPNFTDEIIAIEEEALAEDGNSDTFSDEPDDVLLTKALDYIRATKYASTSMLQRKFRIGYTRAARMMDLFEERGYVGPGQGSKPREVIFAPSTSVIGISSGLSTAGGEEDEEEEDV